MKTKEHAITSEALSFWLKKMNMRQRDLAERTGISQGHISNMAAGARGIPVPNLEKICEAFGISMPEFFACKDPEMPEVVFVPLVKAVPRAGTGGLETDGDFRGWYSFHSSFLRRKGGSEDTMRLFMVDGDSMEPTLFSGDMIMINTAETARHISTGNIYLLRIGSGETAELMIKRLERRPGNILIIRSDNDRYQDIPVNLSEVDGELEIFGRMVWSCREY